VNNDCMYTGHLVLSSKSEELYYSGSQSVAMIYLTLRSLFSMCNWISNFTISKCSTGKVNFVNIGIFFTFYDRNQGEKLRHYNLLFYFEHEDCPTSMSGK
jgi:hypothetical protein